MLCHVGPGGPHKELENWTNTRMCTTIIQKRHVFTSPWKGVHIGRVALRARVLLVNTTVTQHEIQIKWQKQSHKQTTQYPLRSLRRLGTFLKMYNKITGFRGTDACLRRVKTLSKWFDWVWFQADLWTVWWLVESIWFLSEFEYSGWGPFRDVQSPP